MALSGEQFVNVSFECFPPRTSESTALQTTSEVVAPAEPVLMSVTYGAAGSSREETSRAVTWLREHQSAPVMPHVVCAGHTRDELETMLTGYQESGVSYILALAGDLPTGEHRERGSEMRHAHELVALARRVGNFTIGVAANGEQHPYSADLATDRRHLFNKLRAADFAITQFFFHPDVCRRLRCDVEHAGIDRPLLPGILLSTRLAAIERMSAAAGVSVPEAYRYQLARAAQADRETGGRAETKKVVVDHASRLCARLIDDGVRNLHFFTLNQADVTGAVLQNLGLLKVVSNC